MNIFSGYRRVLPLLALLVLWSTTGKAFEISGLPENTAWAVTMDAGRIAESATAERLFEVIMQNPDAPAVQFLQQALTGLSFCEDITSVTVFGLDADRDKSAIKVEGIFNIEMFTLIMQQQNEFSEIKDIEASDDTENKIMHWKMDSGLHQALGHKKRIKGEVYAFFADKNNLYISPGRSMIELLAKPGSLDYSFKNLPDSALICGRGDGPGSIRGLEVASVIGRKVNSAEFALRENNGQMRLDAKMTSTSQQNATDIADILRGGMALARLAAQDLPRSQTENLVAFSPDIIEVKNSGADVTLSFSWPIERVTGQIIKTCEKLFKEQRR